MPDGVCAFRDCYLYGRFTDPRLDGYYCEHHRGVKIRALKEAEITRLLEAKDEADASVKDLRAALEEINPFLKALYAGDTIEMERTLGIINRARDKYPLESNGA